MEQIWTEALLRPMENGLLLIYPWLFGNFGLTIILFTVAVRLAMLPLTMRQLRQSRQMMALQPKMAALRKKYKNDNQRVSQETMALYREAGVNPIGCILPMLLQFPIWIGLYQSILRVMPVNAGRIVPEGFIGLQSTLYPFLDSVWASIPVNSQFLWLDLGIPDMFVMPILVGGSMFIQQKMTVVPGSQEGSQAQMNRTMQTIMPLMFGFFTIQVASGLALYWLVSNLISIALQYFVTGWGTLPEWGPVAAVLARRAAANSKSKAPAEQRNVPDAEVEDNGASAADGRSADAGRSTSRRRRRSHARSRNKRKNS